MDHQQNRLPRCADCTIEKTACRYEDGHGPGYCPALNMTAAVEEAVQEYQRPEIGQFALNATIQEGECYVNRDRDTRVRYAVKPRLQEVIEFAHKMGYRRLGIAFCGGLKHEAKIVCDILQEQGFEVASVMCKVGRTPKEFIGVKEAQKTRPGHFESMCSPIAQAKVLNAAETDFNILLGLCVGHDSLMMRYSDALCTVLVAKDRVTGHNPVAAIQLHHSYYRKLREEKFNKGGAVTVTVQENV